ncbi:MAG TPA: hypothetical protein PKE52_15420, partial [Bacteroidales bacterium]|nr:hypothetical protein [Bacteroidales bacterium]
MKQNINRTPLILLIDNDTGNGSSLEIRLLSENYEVNHVHSFDEATASIKSMRPELILLENPLSEVDSTLFLQSLRL